MRGMSLIVKNATRLVAGFIALFGAYIVLYGHVTPGGGFAGGVIVAGGLVLVVLAFGEEFSRRVISHEVVRTSESLLKRLRDYPGRLYVISSFTPVYLQELGWVESALAVYGDSRDSFRAGFAVLAGDYAPTGKLPLGFMSP